MAHPQRSTHGDSARIACLGAAMLGAVSVNAADDPDTDASLTPRTSESGAALKEQVVVTGTRLPWAAKQSSQDVRIYDQERIEKSGQGSIAELRHLPGVAGVRARRQNDRDG